MSCTCRQVVLRIPASAIGIHTEEAYNSFEKDHPRLLKWREGHFTTSASNCGEKRYFDYVLLDSALPQASALDHYTKSRPLTDREKGKYQRLFRRLSPYVNMDDVHYCDYVWYDGIEAPDCY